MTQSHPANGLTAGIRLAALAALVMLAGCSTVGDFISGDKIDYKSSGNKAPSLDVPPDLTQLTRESRYSVPGGNVTASAFQASQAAAAAGRPAATAATELGDVRIERSGNQRWLVIDRPPEKLWDPVREFWQENGFLLTIEQEATGIMETDFAENRAKLPQDFIRRTIGRVFDGLYSTGERDKFRTRLERTARGSEIYISHRGMIETIPNNSTGSSVWQPKPADPELETEFLRRLMLKLGASAEQVKAAVAQTQRPIARVLDGANNQAMLQIDEDFERAWRRVGLSLDRTGFTVEDRDRSQGLYFVRYVEPSANKKEPSLLSRVFGGSTNPAPIRYRIVVRGQGQGSTVSVLTADGAVDTSANARRIVQLIADDLK